MSEILTINQRRPEPRTAECDGKTYVSVTSAMRLVKRLLNEPEDCYGPPALAKIHAMEGTACHAACLNYLAHAFGWLPTYETPSWPKDHPDQSRWANVMHASVEGFIEFVERYHVEPVAIEQAATSSALGLLGHVDLLALLTWKTRRALAIIDLKFVTAIQESHRLQLRCYARLDQMKGAHVGLLYHANRNTGLWKLEPVDLRVGLDDVAAVANAARLWAWAETRRS